MTRSRNRLWMIAGAALLLPASLVFAMGGTDSALKSARQNGEALPVQTQTVRYQDSYRIRETYTGRVVTRRESALGFEAGGLIQEILVDEGAQVSAGEALARLDRRRLEAERDRLASELELARITEKRQQELAARNNASAQRFDEARFTVQTTQAALRAVEVQIDLAELKAPYDGVIVARLADEGTIAAPGQSVLRIIERDAWEVRVGLPPESAVRLDPEQTYPVDVNGSDSLRARLQTVLPQVDPATRTVLAIFSLEKTPAGLRSGALGRLSLETEVPQRGFWIPVTALTEGRRGLWTAYAVVPADGEKGAGGAKDSGRVERRQVEVLHNETDRAFVRGTFTDGERIVTGGSHRLVPGQSVVMASGLSAKAHLDAK